MTALSGQGYTQTGPCSSFLSDVIPFTSNVSLIDKQSGVMFVLISCFALLIKVTFFFLNDHSVPQNTVRQLNLITLVTVLSH